MNQTKQKHRYKEQTHRYREQSSGYERGGQESESVSRSVYLSPLHTPFHPLDCCPSGSSVHGIPRQEY